MKKSFLIFFIIYITNISFGQEIVCTKTVAHKESFDTIETNEFEKQKGLLHLPVETFLLLDTINQLPKFTCGLGQEENFKIICEPKTKVIAITKGIVTKIAKIDNKWLIIIRHGEYLTVYSNLEIINVSDLQELSSGEIIGQIATTNNETYLEFQLWKGAKRIAPNKWFYYK